MMRKLAVPCFFWLCSQMTAQSPSGVVHDFFNAMTRLDSTTLLSLAVPGAKLCTLTNAKDEATFITCKEYELFVRSMTGFRPGDLDEQIRNTKEEIRGNTATVSMEYDFFRKQTFSHCGINVFHLLKQGASWKITGIDDTRETSPCMGQLKDDAGKLLDAWHHAAATGDSATYFDALAEDAVFIGTDSSEVWSKKQFLSFAAPYFKRGKAWDFEKISRNLHFSGQHSLIWFDEVLDTWMGPCRGSGWISVENNQLKIKQYVLSLTVPNDKMDGVLQVIGANRRKRG